MKVAQELTVQGIVQGVGFRPFVYNLATSLGLNGNIKNSPSGVKIVLEGDIVILKKFIDDLKTKLPPLARIESITVKSIDLKNLAGFEVLESEGGKTISAFLPADIATCAKCRAELDDPNNRRFEYALINCTDCGPRYTIISSLPYDRPNTSMKIFEMCELCKAEYKNPSDRRFHAEPISCPKCGPQIHLFDKNGIDIHVSNSDNAVIQVAKLIEEGSIVAIKGIGGFHIVCRADSATVVSKIRERKRRPKKPFAVMFPDEVSIKKQCKLTKNESELLNSQSAPIVLLEKNKAFNLASNISFESKFLGCFLPYTPLQTMLFKHLKVPIVATSANFSEEPIISDKTEIFERLCDVVDFVLDYERDIINSCDDSVVRVFGTQTISLRPARGYAPLNLKIKKNLKVPTLSLGAQQKSTVSIGVNNHIVTSAYIGDLFGVSSIEKYKYTTQQLLSLYNLKPELAVHDLNNAYESSKFAKELGIETIQIQHHKAHFLAILAEANMLESQALGVIFDGSGLGEDKCIWGGEFFIYDKTNINRVAHLKEFWLLGGEIVAKNPNRSALSFLFDTHGSQVFDMKLPTINSFNKHELEALYAMHKSGANSIKSSSMGRLFDAVASHNGLVQKSSYDGECGLLMESLYDSKIKSRYEIGISHELDFSSVFKISEEPDVGVSKFINTLAYAIGEIANRYKLPVLFSGGVFQNATLCNIIQKELSRRGLKAIFHSKFSPNDTNISIGQTVFASLSH